MSEAVRFPIPSPVHRACAKESGRYQTGDVGAFFNASGDAVLSATDGYMAVFVPVNVSGNKASGRTILPNAAVKACKATRRGTPHITVNGKAEVDGGVSFPLPDQGSFAPVLDIIPDAESMSGRLMLSINPARLAKLAEALGSSQSVVLAIVPNSTRPIVVMASDAGSPDGAFGLLNPAHKLDDDGKKERDYAVERLDKARSIIASANA